MESIVEHISRRIELWLAEDKERTLSDLAVELGMAHTTLRRLRNGEGEPHPENIQCLLPILNAEVVLDYIFKNWPSQAELFKELMMDQVHAKTLLLDIVEKSRSHLQTAMLCSMPDGVDIRSAVLIVGQGADSIIHELVSKDLAFFEDGCYHLREKYFRLSSTTRNTRMIELIAPLFYESDPSDRFSRFGHFSLNYEGYLEVAKLLRKCVVGIVKVGKNPKYKGDRLFFFATISGLIRGIKQ